MTGETEGRRRGAMERWKNKEHNEDRGKAEGELNILLKFKIDFKHT